MTEARPALTRTHNMVLAAWLALAVILAIAAILDSRGATGWEGLIAAVVILLFAVSVASITMSWAVARFLISDSTARTLTLVVGPPVLTTAAVLILRTAG